MEISRATMELQPLMRGLEIGWGGRGAMAEGLVLTPNATFTNCLAKVGNWREADVREGSTFEPINDV